MPQANYTDTNRLWYGDNLTIMRDMPDECVDLIYLDPPFNSKRDYNTIYKDETGNPLPKQVEAFTDTWYASAEMYEVITDLHTAMLRAGIGDTHAKFLHDFLLNVKDVDKGLQPYLTYMIYRLLEMRRLLKPTGSIYLHCDPTASHYLKMVMDCVFGLDNFRNEIVWHYNKWTNVASHFQRNHDVILHYWNGVGGVFNPQYAMTEHKRKVLELGWDRNKPGGVRQLLVYDRKKAAAQIKAGNYDKVVYLDEKPEGVLMSDVWTDIKYLSSNSAERMGWPTQKPLDLLERIIKASSNEGDFVLDPFCGCATTIEAAHNLGRKWMGIDIAIHAIKRVSKDRLLKRLGLVSGEDYEIVGVPNDIEGAIDLWQRDPYHFQKWAIEEIGGYDTGPSAGGKIDGRIWYKTPDSTELGCMAIEVKGGKNVKPDFLHGLVSVLTTHDDVQMAGLITMHPITGKQLANFKEVIARMGSFVVNDVRYDRLQLLSVEEILQGKRFDIPGRIQGETESQPVIPGITRKKQRGKPG